MIGVLIMESSSRDLTWLGATLTGGEEALDLSRGASRGPHRCTLAPPPLLPLFLLSFLLLCLSLAPFNVGSSSFFLSCSTSLLFSLYNFVISATSTTCFIIFPFSTPSPFPYPLLPVVSFLPSPLHLPLPHPPFAPAPFLAPTPSRGRGL